MADRALSATLEKLADAERMIENGMPGRAREIARGLAQNASNELQSIPDVSRICKLLYSTGDVEASCFFAESTIFRVQQRLNEGTEFLRCEVAQLHLVVGMCKEYLDDSWSAVVNYRIAIRGFRHDLETEHPMCKESQTESRARLGQSLSLIGNHVQAETELRAALATTHLGEQNPKLRLKICVMLANELSLRGLYEFADRYFDRALSGLESQQSWIDLAMANITHSSHLIRRSDSLRPYRSRAFQAEFPRQTMQSAFDSSIRATMYLETLRVTFRTAPDRKMWDRFTTDGWSAAFHAAQTLADANLIAELIETRINSTKHGHFPESANMLDAQPPTVHEIWPTRKEYGAYPIAGTTGLIPGAYLPAQIPPPLLLPIDPDRGLIRIGLAQYLDFRPYPSNHTPSQAIRAW